MFKTILILVTICLAAFGATAQTEKYTAPVKWERYAVSDKNVSILFPKLPILIESGNACQEIENRQYAAYAEQIVYGLNITSQSNKKAPDYCKQLKDLKKFNKKSFDARTNELMALLKNAKTEKISRVGLEMIKVSDEFFAYWLINDFKNKRWFEVWTTDRDEMNLKIKDFVESITINANVTGIDIGIGAVRTFGDEETSISEEKLVPNSEDTDIQKLKVILKPKPSYTEAARQANIQGTVRLRVTFLFNGGIGKISVISALPYGLTEQSIAAAAKIVFIPQRKNNSLYTVTKTVEYGFSIY